MPFRRNIKVNLDSVDTVGSVRRAGGWIPTQSTAVGKVLMGITAVVIVGGIAAGVVVPLTMAATQAEEQNAKMTTTTVTTGTTTSATTTTTTTATSTTSTTTSSTTSTTTTTTTASTTTTTATTTTSTTTTTATTTTTTSTTTTTTTTTTSTTTTTTTTTTSIIGCSATGTTTMAPGGQGGASVLYTLDNTPNDYYGAYHAVPVNNPTYVSPGYNGRGQAIQLRRNSSQYLTIANFMNFYQRSLTVEAWIYPLTIYTANPYDDTIIYGQTNASASGLYMWMMLRNGKNYGAFYGNDVWGPTVFQANRWQHMAFTYDIASTTQTVYLNGVADAVNSNAPPCLITAGLQTIGRYPQSAGGFYDGYIDQLTILFNRAKTAAEILADATLVAKYTMDCLSYISWDSGPNQIQGITYGLTAGDGGRVGQSYLFNSALSYFQASGLVLLGQSYRPYSFAMWLRPLVTTNGTIMQVSSQTDGLGWCLPMLGLSSSGQIITMSWNGSTGPSVVGPVLTPRQWVHIAVTYSQTNALRLYVNGALHGQTAAFTYAASSVPMTITLGNHLNGTACANSGVQRGQYYGQIDEFYIFSRELSAADVLALANP